MFDRAEIVLKITCLGLGALLLFQLARMVTRKNPLADVNLAALSALAAGTNSPSGGKGTNALSQPRPDKSGTNSAGPQSSAKSQTNSPLAQASAKSQTNLVSLQGSETNKTNTAVAQAPGKIATNSVAQQGPDKSPTNAVPLLETGKTATASALRTGPGSRGSPSVPVPGMARMGPGGAPGAAPDLPPAIRSRVDRIYQSEILGAIIRPQPMALLGIAGKDAFLRAPTGQTGLLREGEELGGIKLIRIGTNRVLVEENGQQKELMLFSGLGSESLLPTGKEKP